MNKQQIVFGVTALAWLLTCNAAQAQYAPTPRKAPRTPVSKQVLAGKSGAAVPSSRILSGVPTVLDSGRLRVEEIELRLYGVVPPQLGASFGPQARAVVDSLARGEVTCRIKDKESSGPYLAACRDNSGADFGLELLRRGLAATARGTLGKSEYAASYLAAEQAAQAQRLGLWSVSLPRAATEQDIRQATLKAQADRAKLKAAEEAQKAQEEAATAKESDIATEVTPEKIETSAESLPTFDQLNLSPSTGEIAPHLLKDSAAHLPTASAYEPAQEIYLIERYQLLISGVLLLLTALVSGGSFLFYKSRQQKGELKSIAAALRGELMAARSICKARLMKMEQEGSDANISWPRIRVLVFQAYVGRLGDLGSELSRQVASIYGMSSDYAAYHTAAEMRGHKGIKRQALQSLIHYIDEVSPRLALVEEKGMVPPRSHKQAPKQKSIAAPKKPLSLSSNISSEAKTQNNDEGKETGKDTATNIKGHAGADEPAHTNMSINLTQAKAEIVADKNLGARRAKGVHAPEKNPSPQAAAMHAQVASQKRSPIDLQNRHVRQRPPVFEKPVKAPLAPSTAAKLQNAAQSALLSIADINLKAPLFEKLSMLRSFAKSRLVPEKAATPELTDFTIPDYANLTEEELEALLYAEEEMLMASPVGKSQRR